MADLVTILAIDPSSSSSGYALMRGNRVVEHGIFRPKGKLPADTRIECMCDDLAEALLECRPDVVVIEVMVARQYSRKDGVEVSLAVCATAGGAMWGVARCLCKAWGGRVVPVSNIDWTRGVSKQARKVRAGVLCDTYDESKDAKGDKADSICLGEYYRQLTVKAALGIRGGQSR